MSEMTQPQVAPYGSWASPIKSDMVVMGFGQMAFDGDDLYWIEVRPREGGRSVIVRRDRDGQLTDLTPASFNARTRVHEYGGGDFAVAHGALYFSNFMDQRIYRQASGEAPEPLTPAGAFRYADAIIDARRRRLIAVREDHTGTGREAVNTLVSISLQDGEAQVLVSGNDFYSSPRLSPDGSRLAWITWNHPNMPWDGTELWVAETRDDGSLGPAERIAGGLEESIFQPEWSPGGALHFVSDRSGWWNLYRHNSDGTLTPLCPLAAEFGLPQWLFGMSTYAFESAERIICAYTENGRSRLASLDTKTGALVEIETPYSDISFLRAATGRVAFVGGSPTEPASVILLDLSSRRIEVLRRSSDVEIDAGYFSIPQAIEFPTSDGQTAYGFFYPPQNKDYAAPAGERPPLLVKSHGGPTYATSTTLRLPVQYWTSRGIAVLDVNYRGSTGYGRAYRRALNGQWGVYDVDDCVNGALYLVERGLADGARLAITGGSAGGYTTLCALTFRQTFRAGASHYGVSDLETLVRDTHKFESRYLDRLVGPYPERADLYRARSPIHHADQLSCPVIFFQGLEDKVVPPSQAELMVEALRAKGLPVAYVAFEGEQHGFRRAENIKRAMDGELYFYSRIMKFDLADEVEPVPIENL